MAFLRYTILRLGVLAAVLAVFALLGFRGLWLLMVSLLVSGFVSLVVLRRSRDRVSIALSDRLAAIRTRMDERTTAEDAWDDAHRDEPHP